jgi:tRNA wybutosine-synthesizing protein 4
VYYLLLNITYYRYASQLGYFKDEYSKLFLKQKKKMFPIINRGTWARVFSIRQVIDRFVKSYAPTSKFNIISLGAGYDTTFFYLHDKFSQEPAEASFKEKMVYVEIDFDEVVNKKI